MYEIRRAPSTITIDGDLSKPVWQGAERSPRFVDMADGSPAWYDTRSAALWDDEALYISFWVSDPYPRAKLTERDSIIFSESDVEVFIDAGDAYYELEINALNTVYEVLFIWQDAYASFADRLDLRNALSFGGNFDRDEATFWTGTHPRGVRWAFRDFDLPGLETGVKVLGRLNEDREPSEGWTAEIKLPWEGLAAFGANQPRVGDQWRIFFGRFQKMRMKGGEVNPAWCWTPHGRYDTHMPEAFTPVRFVG